MQEAEYLQQLAAIRDEHWPEGYPKTVSYPLGDAPLSAYLSHWAAERPDKTALIYYGREFTFRELDQLSNRFANFLRASGLQVGDRVAVYLPNCPQFLVAFYGILKAGCVHVPVNVMFRDEELAYELEDADPVLVLTLDSLQERVERVRPRTGIKQVVTTRLGEYVPEDPTLPLPQDLEKASRDQPAADDGWRQVLASPATEVDVPRDAHRLAALNYTGGTTGLPKGCEHTQADMVYTAGTASAYRFGDGQTDISVVFVPIFWIAGEDAGIILPIYTGSTCVLLYRWDPVAVLTAIDTYRVTSMAAAVDNYVELMEHPRFKEFDIASLRTAMAMSFVRKLNTDYRRQWAEVAGKDCVLRESSYGMTETHTIDTFTSGFQEDDYDLSGRPTFCGLPMPGTDLKIVDFESGELKPLDQEGEIVIRTPSLFKAYWRRPEATATAFDDGWFHTGDVGFIDTDGMLHFVGRRKEMIKVKGMSVFPSELEVLICRYPEVTGCGVIGRPDSERGEVPVAFVQLREGASAGQVPDDLLRWCRENMAPYKIPEIRVLDSLPLTATGKVRKNLLPLDPD